MIAHIDVDSFFASVLQRTQPALRGKPLLALGMGGGCVIAASYEAKACGITTGMRLSEAKKLCPHAIALCVSFAETALASTQVGSIMDQLCPIVEQYSVDEWFLDLRSCVGGNPSNLVAWADTAHLHILRATDLSASVGVAPSKLLAKMASEYRKPAGRTVIQSDDIPAFLRDRPAAAIPGIGKRREEQVTLCGWHSAWDIANAHPARIRSLFGKSGIDIQTELLGIAQSQVCAQSGPPKSVSRCRSFPRTRDQPTLWGYLTQHAAVTVAKMRSHACACGGIGVWLRDSEYRHQTLQVRLPRAMDTEHELLPYIRTTLQRLQQRTTSYTQVGLCLWHLTPRAAIQLSLFSNPLHALDNERLQQSVDELRTRFGRSAILHGSQLSIATSRQRSLELPIVEESSKRG